MSVIRYIKSINRNAVLEHEHRKAKMLQSSQNTREDLKITFKDNEKLKIALDASIVNPAQFVAIEPILSKVISREEYKNDSMTISDIRGIESACSKKYYHKLEWLKGPSELITLIIKLRVFHSNLLLYRPNWKFEI